MGEKVGSIRSRLPGIAAFLSLLLIATAFAAWVDSFWAAHFWYKPIPSEVTSARQIVKHFEVISSSGSLFLTLEELHLDLTKHMPSPSDGYLAFGQYSRHSGGWFARTPAQTPRWWRGERLHSFHGEEKYSTGLRLPWWLIAIAGIPALVGWSIDRCRRRRREWRRISGRCVACYYDLRSSPTRCPECGLLSETGGSAKDDGNAKQPRSAHE